MNLQDYIAQADAVERDGVAALQAAADSDALEAARIAFLGDRHGRVKTLQEALRDPELVKRFNDINTEPVSQDQATPEALIVPPPLSGRRSTFVVDHDGRLVALTAGALTSHGCLSGGFRRFDLRILHSSNLVIALAAIGRCLRHTTSSGNARYTMSG